LKGRSLESLDVSQERELILHLIRDGDWKLGDVQKLVGSEGMRELFGYGEKLPFGFVSAAEYRAFREIVIEELRAAGIPMDHLGIRILLHGSAVRGRSESGTPYRWEGDPQAKDKGARPSDVDIAIVADPQTFSDFVDLRGKELGARLDGQLPDGTVVGGKRSDGSVIGGMKSVKRFNKVVSDQRRLDIANLPPDVRAAYGRIKDRLRALGITRPLQISIVRRGGAFDITNPDEAMILSATGTFPK
jgi:hypothetical protein